jgi:hypothetical protein
LKINNSLIGIIFGEDFVLKVKMRQVIKRVK